MVIVDFCFGQGKMHNTVLILLRKSAKKVPNFCIPVQAHILMINFTCNLFLFVTVPLSHHKS